MSKKYYWLKLDRNFFKRHDIRIIENKENGKEFVLFYLKLITESIDHDGLLRFNQAIPYDSQMLSIITNTDKKIVDKALDLFIKLDIIEIDQDQTIIISGARKMIGAESYWAQYKRAERNKDQNEPQKEESIPSIKSFDDDEFMDSPIDHKNKEGLQIGAKKVLDFLNNHTKADHRPVKTNINLIIDRLKSGITIRELQQIIARKTEEWKDDAKLKKHLVPKTLFEELKCENYLGALRTDKKQIESKIKEQNYEKTA